MFCPILFTLASGLSKRHWMMTKNPKDAIGINKAVADRLSGADFDGDTVLVIPLSRAARALKSTSPLEGLKDFDPKELYPEVEGMTYMKYKRDDGTTVDKTQV